MSKEQIEREDKEMLDIIAKSREEYANDVTEHTENEYIREGLLNAGYRKQVEGEWGFDGMSWTCSECGEYATKGIKTTFCPNCGAKMKGGAR